MPDFANNVWVYLRIYQKIQNLSSSSENLHQKLSYLEWNLDEPFRATHLIREGLRLLKTLNSLLSLK